MYKVIPITFEEACALDEAGVWVMLSCDGHEIANRPTAREFYDGSQLSWLDTLRGMQWFTRIKLGQD
jgi:hypothetical protein